jgi:hypothetical protein
MSLSAELVGGALMTVHAIFRVNSKEAKNGDGMTSL